MIGDQPSPAKPIPARWRIVVSMVLLLGVTPAVLFVGERWGRPDLGIAPRARPWTMQDVGVLGAAALVTGGVLTWLIRDTKKMVLDAYPIDKAKPPRLPTRTLMPILFCCTMPIILNVSLTVLVNWAWSSGGFLPGLIPLAVQKGILLPINFACLIRFLLLLQARQIAGLCAAAGPTPGIPRLPVDRAV